MGSSRSSLVKDNEITAFVQRDYYFFASSLLCCANGSGTSGFAMFSEPARFNEPKPFGLDPLLSDDTWAALKLRVDPLAKKILDPHRSYAGAAFLALLLTAVFSAVRPSWNISSYYEDDDGPKYDDGWFDDYFDDRDKYVNKDVDDIVKNAMSYQNEKLQKDLLYWRIGFYSSLSILLFSTIGIAIGMEMRNAQYDGKIRAVCDEMRERFRAEGFSIDYRTRADMPGILFGLGRYMRPERVIVFRDLTNITADCEAASVGDLSYKPLGDAMECLANERNAPNKDSFLSDSSYLKPSMTPLS